MGTRLCRGNRHIIRSVPGGDGERVFVDRGFATLGERVEITLQALLPTYWLRWRFTSYPHFWPHLNHTQGRPSNDGVYYYEDRINFDDETGLHTIRFVLDNVNFAYPLRYDGRYEDAAFLLHRYVGAHLDRWIGIRSLVMRNLTRIYGDD